MRLAQIVMPGLLLRTTRRIHWTHSTVGGWIPLGGMRFSYFLSSFCLRSPVDQILGRDVGVDGHGKQSTRHDIFSRGSRGGPRLDFGGKLLPLKCNTKMVTPYLGISRCVLEPKGAEIWTDQFEQTKVLVDKNSSYDVWSKPEVVYFFYWT